MKPKNKILTIKIASGVGILLFSTIFVLTRQHGLILGAVLQQGDYFYNLVTKQNSLGTYVPPDLVELKNLGAPHKFIRAIIYPDLAQMVRDAGRDGVKLKIISAYRSYQTQAALFASYKRKSLDANRFSAESMHSEHQLGTTVDFGADRSRSNLTTNFGQTPQGLWLAANAWKYGFSLSYPEGGESITGYIYEPWHYRYIGIEAAAQWHNSGQITHDFLKTKDQYFQQ